MLSTVFHFFPQGSAFDETVKSFSFFRHFPWYGKGIFPSLLSHFDLLLVKINFVDILLKQFGGLLCLCLWDFVSDDCGCKLVFSLRRKIQNCFCSWSLIFWCQSNICNDFQSVLSITFITYKLTKLIVLPHVLLPSLVHWLDLGCDRNILSISCPFCRFKIIMIIRMIIEGQTENI